MDNERLERVFRLRARAERLERAARRLHDQADALVGFTHYDWLQEKVNEGELPQGLADALAEVHRRGQSA